MRPRAELENVSVDYILERALVVEMFCNGCVRRINLRLEDIVHSFLPCSAVDCTRVRGILRHTPDVPNIPFHEYCRCGFSASSTVIRTTCSKDFAVQMSRGTAPCLLLRTDTQHR